MAKAVSVVIVNWNGQEILQACLPGIMIASDNVAAAEVILVDNGSTDGSLPYVRSTFPTVTVIELDTNYGLGPATNIGVARSSCDIVVILNNDILPDECSFGPLVTHFDDDRVFAVAATLLTWDGSRVEHGVSRPRFQRGAFSVDIDNDISQLESAVPTLYAPAGAAAFSRSKYLVLGGLDDLFQPFYAEDLDLGYQAWKRGWQVLLEPSSRFRHMGGATIKPRFSAEQISSAFYRNQLLFLWKNLDSKSLLVLHLLTLIPRTIKYLFIRDMVRVCAVLTALTRWRKIARRRAGVRNAVALTDRELLSRFPRTV